MPFPYLTTSILRLQIQWRNVEGRMPRAPEASTTVSSSSGDASRRRDSAILTAYGMDCILVNMYRYIR